MAMAACPEVVLRHGCALSPEGELQIAIDVQCSPRRVKNYETLEKFRVCEEVLCPTSRTLGSMKKLDGGDKRQPYGRSALDTLTDCGQILEKIDDNIGVEQILIRHRFFRRLLRCPGSSFRFFRRNNATKLRQSPWRCGRRLSGPFTRRIAANGHFRFACGLHRAQNNMPGGSAGWPLFAT